MEDPEHLSNIGLVCDEHAPKTGAYKDQDPESFIGCFVKLGFSSRQGPKEFMWVKVEAYNAETKELEGKLNNDPVYDVGVECNDDLAFTLEEICDVMEGSDLGD